MRVAIAIDSFKGSLTSLEAGNSAKAGILEVYPDAYVNVFKMADGGEGTMDTIISSTFGELVKVEVSDPLGRPITSKYGYIPETKTAVIEMAEASGITLISAEERNPMLTSTYGTGQIIKDAVNRGCRDFIIGIGGSATNDGGVGMLEALGFEFVDENDCNVERGAVGLSRIAKIKTDNALTQLKDCHFSVACDVKNPLCGLQGCSCIYGPQKGATAEMITQMDSWLEKYADITKAQVNPLSDPNCPGAGAAGGMGFALMAYLGAELRSGIELVIEKVGAERYIAESDIVITGEGRLDGQSGMGKVPSGIAAVAKKYGKPVIAFSGAVGDSVEMLNDYGIDAFFPILRKICTLDEAMEIENASENLQKTVSQVFRLIKIIKGE